MARFIAVYAVDMFLGTPEQFDDAFGGGVEWDDIGCDKYISDLGVLSEWVPYTKPEDIEIHIFDTEAERAAWFADKNRIIDIDASAQSFQVTREYMASPVTELDILS